MPNRIGVIGEKDCVLAFKAVGLEVFPAENAQDAAAALRRAVKEEFAVVLITEDLARENEELIKKYKPLPYPAVIPIPGAKGPSGYGVEGIRQDVEKAIGADILFNIKN